MAKSGIITLLFCLFMSGCELDKLPEVYMYGVETIVPVGDENYLNNSSDYIFNQNSLPTFELIIPDEALAFLDADPAAEKYVPATVIFNGETISPVAVRYKGSIGSFAGCLTGGDVSSPSGSKSCTKLSMKIDFSYYQDDYKFFDLNKLQFNSMNHDRTQMHERLGYWLFREMGVPAPRCIHARLIINGVYSGLYALVENMDEQFAKYNFNNGDGNLYKEVWPTSSKGKAYSERFYLNHLKTNMQIHHEKVLIKDFGDEIEDAESEDLSSVIAGWMDIDKTIAFAVVDRTIRADDGPFHWYEHNGRIYNHNYFWYEEPDVEKLYLIPYDLDNAFENIKVISNSITAIADDWGEITSDCKAFEYLNSGKKQRSAACDKLTGGWMSFTDEYQNIKSDFLNGPFSEEILNPLLDSWAEQIYEATLEADRLHEDAIPEFIWNQHIRALKESLDFARNK